MRKGVVCILNTKDGKHAGVIALYSLLPCHCHILILPLIFCFVIGNLFKMSVRVLEICFNHCPAECFHFILDYTSD